MTEFLWTLAWLLLLLGAVAIGLYFLSRWLLERAADRAIRHLERTVGRLSRDERVAALARAARTVTEGVPGERLTGWARYAAAEGVSALQAKEQFQKRIARVAALMDSAVEVPILGRVGLDALLGLLPFVGDATSAAVSLTLIVRGLQFGIPRELVAKMLANVVMDMLLGAIPVVGDIADVWYRANARNVTLMRDYLESGSDRSGTDPR